jgi:hypothetical protein
MADCPITKAAPNEALLMSANSAADSGATPAASSAGSQTAAPASSGSKLDPLAGLGIGIGLLIVLSVLGALAAEVQKRRRASKVAQKKLKAEIEANPDLLRDL